MRYSKRFLWGFVMESQVAWPRGKRRDRLEESNRWLFAHVVDF